MTSIYVRKFDQNGYEKSDTIKYPVSRYFPKSMLVSLKIGLGKNGPIRTDDYIIGPLYKSGEFQIGMTGTVEEKESSHHAAARELGEEIGLVPKNDFALKPIRTNSYDKGGKKIIFTVYDAYIKKCMPVLAHQNNADLSKGNDCSNKVGCYVYGLKRDILDFLNGQIYRYKSEDDIVGLVAIKAEDIFKLGL
jgi:hypothetical protein